MRTIARKFGLVAGRQLFAWLVLLPVLVAGVAGQVFLHSTVVAAQNDTINFQARLMNAAGAIAPDGDYNVEFKLYDTASTGGTAQGVCTGNCKWVETRTSGNKVHVANGYITVELGSVTSLPTTINWDQQLWLTMNIGGTGTASWDGEMSPRLKLTAVPYAFSAGQLAKLAGSNTAVLQFAASFAQNTVITLPDPTSTTATVCYQNSTDCGFLTGAATDYIQNQNSTDQTANFRINGTGRANTSLLAPLFDTPSGTTTLNIGTTNATAGINLNQNTTIAAGKTLTVTSALTSLTGATTGDALNVSNSTSTGNIAVFKDNATAVFTIGDGGATTLQNETNQLNALKVVTTVASGTHTVLNVDTINERVGIGGVAGISKLEVQGGDAAIYNSGNNPRLILGDSTSAGQNGYLQWDSTNDYFRIETSGTNGLKINDNFVAIGNIFPNQPLIVGNGSTNLFQINTAGVEQHIGGQTRDITTADAATAATLTLQAGVSTAASGTGATTAIMGGNASGTTSVTGGGLTLQGGNATGASGTRNGGAVTIDGGTGATANGAVNIGTSNAALINIGAVGTTAKATTVHIADTSTSTAGAIQNVTIGSNSNLAHTTIIQGGNSNTAGSEAIRIVPQTTGGIAIGSTTGTGTITLGQSTAANTINIGSADFTGANTQSINIANGLQTTGASTLNVSILSNTGNGNAGTAFLRLGNNDRVQQIDIGNVVSDGNRTLNMFTGNTIAGVTDTINLGTGNAAGSKVIHIGDGTPSGSGVNTITVGSTALSSTTTIQGGTGSGAVSVQAGSSGTISVGTSNANTVTVGSTSVASVVNINGGNGSTGNITLQSNNAATGTIIKSATNSTNAFEVQNSSGTNGILLNVDSTNGWFINNTVAAPGNLVENPSFEANGAFQLSGWNYTAQSAITTNSGNAHTGQNEMVSTANGTAFNISGLKYLAAQPGDKFYAELWYKVAASTNGAASFSFQYYDASKTNIGSSTATNFSNAQTTYASAVVTGTAPASTAYVRLSIGVNATSTTGTWYWDDAYITKVNEGGQKLFKNTANSTTAFVIQDAGGNNYLTADTSGANINIGYASTTTTLTGTVKLANVGAYVSTSAAVCRDTATGTLTACDSSNSSGVAFLQGGNSFGAVANLGTNDANDLNIRTGGTTRLTVAAAGGVTLASGNALTVTSALTSLTGATTGNALTVSNSTSTGNIAVFKDNATAVATISDGGAVLLQNTTDSSTAFQVKTSTTGTNATVLGVDTTNARVGIGTAAPSRTLHVYSNNTTTTAPQLLVEQAGTGDASFEYKTTSGSFYTGIDNSDGGKFKISSTTANGGTITSGYTTSAYDGLDASGNVNMVSASQITSGASAGTLNTIRVYFANAAGSAQIGLYTDTGANAPGTLLATSASQTAVNGWNTFTMPATAIAATTNYWIGFNVNSSATQYGELTTVGRVAYQTAGATYGSWPSPFGTPIFANTGSTYLVNMTYTPAGSIDSFAGNLFSLTSTGQAAFQNYADSSTAFQVLNAAGTAIIGVDTSSPTVNLGVTGTAAQASTVNIANSYNATQTVTIGGVAGASANGTTVLIQGGNSGGAVQLQALAGGSISIGTNNAANILQVGSNTLSSGTQVINIGNNSTSGGTTNITIGTGSGATGGTTTVQGKTATNVTSNGAVTITAAAASTWSTTTGNLSIQAGASSGVLSLTGGAATGATTAGSATLQGGAASATAGSAGGGVNIVGAVGTTTGTGGAGGSILLNAGNAGGSGNNAGGNITLNLGGATGSGTSGSFFVQNSLGANLLTVDPSNTYNGLNLAANPGAEVSGTFSTNWTAHAGTGSPTITQDTTAGEYASGTAGVKIATTNANQGVRNNLGAALTVSTTYIVSFSVKSSTSISDLTVGYYRNNTPTLDASCANYSSQAADSTGWKKITCTIATTSTAGNTTAFLAITQVASATRNIFIDNLSIVAQNSSGTSNVGDLKVGGALSQGLTLLTLDTYAGTPFSGTNASLAGSMYFDTSSGKIQCYDGTTWGACGAAPNGIVTLTPEYAGAVLNGTGIGTMTSDFCANSGALTVGSLCGTNDARNFYKWTSPQGTAQAYSIYVTYKLPPTFKSFVGGTTSLTGLVDSTTNATVKYAIFKSTGSAITQCSALSTVVGWNGSSGVGSANTWTTGVAGTLSGTTDPSTCSFAAGNNIIFQIQVSANSNAASYAENLNFQYSNQ